MKNTVNAEGRKTAKRTIYTGLLCSLVFLAACNSGLEPQVPEANLSTQAGSCLNSSGKLIKLSGTYSKVVSVTNTTNARVDARNATVKSTPSFSAYRNRGSFCLSGGTFSVAYSASVSWSTAVSRHGIIFYQTPNSVIENIAVLLTNDGVSYKEGNDNFIFRDSYIKKTLDDGIENDRYSNGTVDDVLVDSAFTAISCRTEKKGTPKNYTFTVKNSLIAMDPHRSIRPFKVTLGSGNRCKLNVRNNIFLLPDSVDFLSPGDHPHVRGEPLSCGGDKNIVVYTGGSKSVFERLKRSNPSCFTVTTDKSVWTKARNAWFSEHPQFAKYR